RRAWRVRTADVLLPPLEVLAARGAGREGGPNSFRSTAVSRIGGGDARARPVLLVRRSILLDPDHRQFLDALRARQRRAAGSSGGGAVSGRAVRWLLSLAHRPRAAS